MATQEWIAIPKWDKFYEKKAEVKAGKRRMTWCKNYFDLLFDDAYLSLSPETRSLLHGIWMLFGSTRGEVPKSTRYLSQRLSQRVTKTQLELLNQAGFITFSGTKPVPLWFQLGAVEVEGEEEQGSTVVESPSSSSTSMGEEPVAAEAGAAAPASSRNGGHGDDGGITLDEFLRRVHAGELPLVDEGDD